MNKPMYIPSYTTTFIGRDRITAEICTMLRDHEPGSFVTLVGASGAGKTRLSLQVADVMATETEGVYFIPLAPVRSSHFVVQTIAHTLDISENGIETILEALIRQLKNRSIVLILDNFEQVIDAADNIVQLARHLPNTYIFVTSQHPLNVPEERVFEVPPLRYPERTDLDLEAARSYTSIQLFEDRIRTVQPKFRLTTSQIPAVIEICQLLKGLPLSIELVAAHSDILLPTDLVLLLRNHLRLSVIKPTHDSRDRMVWAVLEWCYTMVSTDEQRLFRQLSIFEGGATLEAITNVCSNIGEPEQIKSLLKRLRDKHFLEEEQLPEAAIRYIMLDAVHSYARRKLPHDEAHLMAECHAQYYLAFIQAQQDQINQYAFAAHNHIHNIRAALEWFLAHEQPDAALELAALLQPVWYTSGALSEGRNWIKQALQDPKKCDPEHVAKARQAASTLAIHQGDHHEARQLLEQNRDYYTSVNNQLELAKIWNNLSLTLINLGDYEPSKIYLKQLIEYGQTNNVPLFEAVGQINLAMNYINQPNPDYQTAAFHNEAAQHLLTDLNNQYALLQVYYLRAIIALAADDIVAAETNLTQQLQLAQELQYSKGVADALSLQAYLGYLTQKPLQGIKLVLEALKIQRELDNIQGLIVAYKSGVWLWSLIDPAQAVIYYSGLEAIRAKTSIAAVALDTKIEQSMLQHLKSAVPEPSFTKLWQQGADTSWYTLLEDFTERAAALEHQ